MPMEENSSKRKNDDVEEEGFKRQNIELIEFPKYVKLANEMRHHILTYCTKSTLRKYSECSKVCNSEIQRFNTKAPEVLEIKEEHDGVEVNLSYRDAGSIERKFVFSAASNTMEEMRQYLLKVYKYVTQKTDSRIEVDVSRWPLDVMEIEHIRNIEEWHVTVCESMFDDCIEYLKSINDRLRILYLGNCDEILNRVSLSPDFFKTELFKSILDVNIYLDSEIDSEDFINSQHEYLRLPAPISSDDIRAKVGQWNNTVHSKKRQIVLDSLIHRQVFNVFEMFPLDQIEVIHVDGEEEDEYCIGKVRVWLEDNNEAFVMYVGEDDDS